MSAEDAGSTIRSLKTDNETFRLVKKLVASLFVEMPNFASERFNKDVAHLLAENSFDDLDKIISLRKAICTQRGENTENHKKIRDCAEKLIEENACLSIKSLDVSGKDLADAGIPQSAEMGRILRKLLWLVIEGKVENKREALVDAAKKI